MTRILGLVLAASLTVGLAGASWAEGARTTVEETITSQIEAFKVDDFAEAFTYASPNIKRLFGTPDRFGMMVRQGYPMVWRPSEVEFLDRDQADGITRQRVLVRDQAGQGHVLEYYMTEGPDGWQIDGVTKLPAPDVAV
ncbi:DUF4864 domain-containing protein [Pseudaestuariivita sp.]|uniref:DUF4864 domain-containing protein n=1 Tax=Pseudaestuariivita sp. TaxID=2211669 RepID=UPI004059F055